MVMAVGRDWHEALTGWALLFLPAACSPASAEPPPPARVSASSRHHVASLVHGLDVEANEACMRCHPLQAQQWLGSQHQTSYVESPFQVAHALEPRAFCRGCHAPMADPSTRPPQAQAALGVACTSCHVQRDGALVSTTALRTEGCLACHEFPFPDNALRDRPLMMQSTGHEHADSRFADRSCADCHMPRAADGHHDHRFVASRDPQQLRRAVTIAAERVDAQRVRITLAPGQVGHAFPTGDLLRRLEVGVQRADGEGPVRHRYLARHFGNRTQRSGAWMLSGLRDDRVPPAGARVVELRLSDASDAPIRWWVQYQRVAHQRSLDPRDAALDGAVTLATGALPAPETSP